MTSTRGQSWQDIQEILRQRIRDRIWSPGELIPGEAVLAEQFGCARTTVNRALRELAATGVIDRKRKAGTRVAEQSTRRVSADIPVIRLQIEQQGMAYSFEARSWQHVLPPQKINKAMNLSARQKALHTRCIHYADDRPYIYEDRWVNTKTIPEVLEIDYAGTNLNEWLVRHVPFTEGDFVVSLALAAKPVASALSVERGASVLKSTRSTWQDRQSVTVVELYYCPGYEMKFTI
ncbi:MAG: GntR family transcriptional regulator [Granulosicoccus sp.]|nr:GntR family transcriptional regulator [Granulosicoccus sp.]